MPIITRFGGSGGGTPIVCPYPHVWECTVVQSGTVGVVSGVVNLEPYDILHYTMPLGFSTYTLMIGGTTYTTSFLNDGEMYIQWDGNDFVVVSAAGGCTYPHVWTSPTYTITGSVLEITGGVDNLATDDIIVLNLSSGESASVIEIGGNLYPIDETITDSQTNYVMFNGSSFNNIGAIITEVYIDNVLTAVSAIYLSSSPTSVWEIKQTITNGVIYATASSVGTKVYLMCGENGSQFDYNQIYDTTSNSWSSGTTCPYTTSAARSESYSDSIYLLTILGSAMYDTTTDTWSTKATMTTPRRFGSSGINGSDIYMIGGIDTSSNISNKNECYSITTNTWSTKVDLPTATRNHAGCCLDDGVYVIGGRDSGTNYLQRTYCYDVTLGTWSTKTNMPTGRTFLAASPLNGKVYAIGGGTGTYSDVTEAYDPDTNTWSTESNLNYARADLCSCTCGSNIYALGGGSSPRNYNEKLTVGSTYSVTNIIF